MHALPVSAVLLLGSLLVAGCGDRDVPPAEQEPADFRLDGVRGGFRQPIFAGHAGDGSGRLFVAEQRGVVHVLRGGDATVFLDIEDRVQAGGERGLLGLAFHPDFERNGRLFVHYSDRSGDTVLSEFTVGAGGLPPPSSERILLLADQPYANHNGGMVAFGPDGLLYLGLGDGGSANDPQDRAQNLDNLLGKLLRLDVDGVCVDGQVRPRPYCIPEDNPFADRERGAEIWAYGLRNPWRFSFDRETGDLWIGDVGQGLYEEIDVQPASSQGGENYGWSRFEGRHVHLADRDAPDAVDPVAEYDHDGGHCSVTGGYVYRGQAIAGLRGTYLLGDYCTGVMWTVRPDGDAYRIAQVMDTPHNISSFGEDEAGELYVVDHGGELLKVVPA